MGCNLALQDTLVLANAFEGAPGDIAAGVRVYDAARASSARYIARTSERLDSFDTFMFHRNPLRALWGLPARMTASASNPQFASRIPSARSHCLCRPAIPLV